MEQRVTVHQGRSGGRQYRVVRVGDRPGRLSVLDEQFRITVYADRAGLSRLLAAWSLAARSPHTLVHLPLRTRPAPANPPLGDRSVRYDLVLAHHSLQFPPTGWKHLRSRLDPGRPQTTRTPDADFTTAPAATGRRHHRETHDHLRYDLAAHTLFVTGSAPAYRDHGVALRDLLATAPALHHTLGPFASAGGHERRGPETTLLPAQPLRHTLRHDASAPTVLNVQYCPDWYC
ncbi:MULTISPECIES: hypothetical protein [Kitasatospora]|uniref:Uncharacterized protein n=1 Tax=Kitasatospora setae (strain ATCC 33774 / DSM 43861 / JCM 3304 / KCC A-0304 / NBRC 14216 / KM-6054) TaxID=452652 RepID=E4NJB9_KITSK|nr:MULTISPECIES: hypothetical protein [Kitasatospora]BAJ33067.1 hypothetical protein KSE_73120 [Kitasatospora setae KM-6054]